MGVDDIKKKKCEKSRPRIEPTSYKAPTSIRHVTMGQSTEVC